MRVVTVLNKNRIKDHPLKCEYDESHVELLRRQVEMRLPDAEFVCLRNEDYPGWWAKMHVFKERGEVLYLDLDTLVLNDCHFLRNYGSGFWALENVNKAGDMGSGVMYWSEDMDMSYLFDVFEKDAERYISEYTTGQKWGDQGFIRDHVEEWKILNPYRVVSVLKNPERVCEADIGYFHGNRKPWNMPEWSGYINSFRFGGVAREA
jgi:hypothetical protein